jgi:hypothetical protein
MLFYHINEKSQCCLGVREVRGLRLGVRGIPPLPLAPRHRRDKTS